MRKTQPLYPYPYIPNLEGGIARGGGGSGGGGGGGGSGGGVDTVVPVLPVATTAKSVTGTTGTLTLTVQDTQGRVQRIEFQTQVGVGAPSAWTPDATIPYSTTVAIVGGVESVIRWRVIGFDLSGNAEQLLLADEAHFSDVTGATAADILAIQVYGAAISKVTVAPPATAAPSTLDTRQVALIAQVYGA